MSTIDKIARADIVTIGQNRNDDIVIVPMISRASSAMLFSLSFFALYMAMLEPMRTTREKTVEILIYVTKSITNSIPGKPEVKCTLLTKYVWLVICNV